MMDFKNFEIAVYRFLHSNSSNAVTESVKVNKNKQKFNLAPW